MRSLWYTSYLASSLTFIALLYVEWQIPGFVSTAFPVTILLPIMLVSGIGALRDPVDSGRVRRMHEMLAVLGGLVLAIVVFRAGDAFGALRLLLAMLVLVLPLLLMRSFSGGKP